MSGFRGKDQESSFYSPRHVTRMAIATIGACRFAKAVGAVLALRGDWARRYPSDPVIRAPMGSDHRRASSKVKALALAHAQELGASILEMQAMQRTPVDLSKHCRGNQRPECPILDDLAG